MAEGTLAPHVRPPYVGLASNGSNGGPIAEPLDDPNYARGMITWRTEDGIIAGSAQVHVPAGTYTHMVFFWGPDRVHALASYYQFEQPAVYNEPAIVVIDPITE